MSDAITAPANGSIRAAHDSGPRIRENIKLVVLHSTEGGTAHSNAEWFANPRSEGSANMVVDDDTSYRTLPDLTVPWACPGANVSGWSIEHAGFAHWTRKEWLKHPKMLKRSAYKTALRCRQYEIPVRWVGPIGIRFGRKGITSHRAVSYAYPILARAAGFHTDPGLGFPRDVYLGYVRLYLAGEDL